MEQGRWKKPTPIEWKQSSQGETFPSKEWVWGTNYLCKHLQNVHRVNIQQTKGWLQRLHTEQKWVHWCQLFINLAQWEKVSYTWDLKKKKKQSLSMVSVTVWGERHMSQKKGKTVKENNCSLSAYRTKITLKISG